MCLSGPQFPAYLIVMFMSLGSAMQGTIKNGTKQLDFVFTESVLVLTQDFRPPLRGLSENAIEHLASYYV